MDQHSHYDPQAPVSQSTQFQPQQQMPVFAQSPFPSANRQPRTDGYAVAAMVLGILSVVAMGIGLITGIIAVVLAARSFKEIRRTGNHGHGMAVAGLVCGIVSIVFSAFIVLLLIIGIFASSSDDRNNYNDYNIKYSATASPYYFQVG